MNLELLLQLLSIAMFVQILSLATVQKIKEFGVIKKCWIVRLASMIINFSLGILFSFTFTDGFTWSSLWIGFFSWLGADTLYKSLEDKGLLKRLSETLPNTEDTWIDDDTYVG